MLHVLNGLTLTSVNPLDGSLTEYNLSSDLFGIRFSHDGLSLHYTRDGTTVMSLNVFTQETETLALCSQMDACDYSVSENNERVVLMGVTDINRRTVLVFEQGEFIMERSYASYLNNIVFSLDGNRVCFYSRRSLFVTDFRTGKTLFEEEHQDCEAIYPYFLTNGNLVYCDDNTGYLVKFDNNNELYTWNIVLFTEVLNVRSVPGTDSFVMHGLLTNTLEGLRVHSNEGPVLFSVDVPRLSLFTFDPETRNMVVLSSSCLTFYDSSTGQKIRESEIRVDYDCNSTIAYSSMTVLL
jgi:hypothetical protein